MNFRHLQYFWATAHAGGIVKAGEQLHTSPQTLSGQIKLLEDRLGQKLFRKSGRKLELTADGRVALAYADEIFHLGSELEAALRGPGGARRTLEFRVGVANSVAKTVVYRLLEPALQLPDPVHMVCSEGDFDDLLGQLALRRVDLVIADEPLSKRVSVKAFNHPLGHSTMSFFATPALQTQLEGVFPQCLDGAPMLIPGPASSIRAPFDAWLGTQRLRPRVVGEFDDLALMATFGREGRGVFVSPSVLAAETEAQHGVRVIGRSDELVEQFYAISVERRISHPCVVAITSAARNRLFEH
ncbi:transcriptional activator NhaR [Pseudorhodoferax sp.]|uniref:transcriptional activator NhaR n=1 Tax=Pseudorhodoferax sp. TaxID=1993553 RepID=UPI002DD64639|nr:transcriptional activator NhaR [Pseudorhodoferax sp.]